MITVEHLTKYYGDHLAVDDLSFEIPEGHVYGFLGPNGAGKSTTMNIITGCLSATDGKVQIGGHDIFDEPLAAKRLVGYLPEQPPLYTNETPADYLKFVGMAKGLRGAALKEQIEHVMEQTGISHVKNRRIATLSKGYKQRVGIAQALLGDPEIIILDEPTVGLDPLQIIEIRQLIRDLGEDHTVILSSHILTEVQAICDRILMIAKGKLVAFDTPENLTNQLMSPNEIILTTDADPEEVTALISSIPSVTDSSVEIKKEGDKQYLRIHLKTDLPEIYDFSRQIFQHFAAGSLNILEMNLKRADLEDIFVELAEDPLTGQSQSKARSESESDESDEISEPDQAAEAEQEFEASFESVSADLSDLTGEDTVYTEEKEGDRS